MQHSKGFKFIGAIEIVVRAVGFDGAVLDALEVGVGAGPASNATKLLACTVQHAWEVHTCTTKDSGLLVLAARQYARQEKGQASMPHTIKMS